MALGYGFRRMTLYDLTAGALAAAPAAWPIQTGPSQLRSATDGTKTKMLLLFAHPQCSCTRATIGNLAAVLARGNAAAGIRTVVVFFEPHPHAGFGWEQSDLVSSARRLPNVSVIFDAGGELARRFGAETSGQVLLYDAAGQLLFSGGVTDERGHYGDSVGGDAITEIASGEAPQIRTTPVYGCSLLPAHSVQPGFSMNGMQMTPPNGRVGNGKR